MSIELKIIATDTADLHKQMRALLGGTAPFTITGDDGKATVGIIVGEGGSGGGGNVAAPKGTKPKAPEPEAQPVEEVLAVGETACEQLADEPMVEAEEHVHEGLADLTYEGDIKPAVLKVSAKHGRPGVEKLLADFNAPNAKDIPVEKWGDLLAAIDKLLGA